VFVVPLLPLSGVGEVGRPKAREKKRNQCLSIFFPGLSRGMYPPRCMGGSRRRGERVPAGGALFTPSGICFRPRGRGMGFREGKHMKSRGQHSPAVKGFLSLRPSKPKVRAGKKGTKNQVIPILRGPKRTAASTKRVFGQLQQKGQRPLISGADSSTRVTPRGIMEK